MLLLNNGVEDFIREKENFKDDWKIAFNIFVSDLRQHLIEQNSDLRFCFITFKSLSNYLYRKQNGGKIYFRRLYELKNFRYPFLLNTRLPFNHEINRYKLSWSNNSEFINVHPISLINSVDAVERNIYTRQIYFSLLDRTYKNTWKIYNSKYNKVNRSDFSNVRNQRVIEIPKFFLIGTSGIRDIKYVPIECLDFEIPDKIVEPYEAISFNYRNEQLEFTVTPFGVIVWERRKINNLIKIFKTYDTEGSY